MCEARFSGMTCGCASGEIRATFVAAAGALLSSARRIDARSTPAFVRATIAAGGEPGCWPRRGVTVR